MLLTAGLRRSEALGLTWDVVDLEKGALHVRHQLIDGQLVQPKTDNALRTVPIPKATVEALRQRRMVCPPSELNLVFTTPTGRAINPSNFFNRVWKPLREAACLPDGTTIHQLRKTYASLCAHQGRTPAWLAEVMGHSKASTTLAFYTGVMHQEREAAQRDLDSWISREAWTAYPQTVVEGNRESDALALQ